MKMNPQRPEIFEHRALTTRVGVMNCSENCWALRPRPHSIGQAPGFRLPMAARQVLALFPLPV